MSGPSQVIILGEDSAHVGSAYRAVVDHFGVPAGRVLKLRVSSGQGDAMRHVLMQVPQEIERLRRRASSAVLIILLDGDGETIEKRIAEINQVLTKNDSESLRPDERIAVVVPRRNVETWLEFAKCSAVDENADYKQGRRSNWDTNDFKLVGSLLGQRLCPKSDPPSALEAARHALRVKLANSS